MTNDNQPSGARGGEGTVQGTLLTRMRGVFRRQLTMLERDVSGVLETNNIDMAAELLERMSILETKLNELNRKVAEEVGDGPTLEDELMTVCEYDEKIARCRARMKRVLTRQSPEVITPTREGSTSGEILTLESGGSNVNRTLEVRLSRESSTSVDLDSGSGAEAPTGASGMPYGNRGCTIRLPKLEMPKFSGDVQKWPAFWSAFSSSIHENQNLSTVDKFNYLRSVLTDNAFRSIEGLTVTDSNYETAVKRIKERYGRKDLVVDSLLAALDKLSRPSNDPAALRRFYDDIDIRVVSLKNLGVDMTIHGELLKHRILERLPDELKFEWGKIEQNLESYPKFTDVMEFLRKQVELRERVKALTKSSGNDECSKKVETKRPEPKARTVRNVRTVPSTSALNVTSNAQSKTKLSCSICEGNHPTLECNIDSVTERLEKLKASNRCFNCLWKSHHSRNCQKEKAICKFCRGSHHTALCANRNRTEQGTLSRTSRENTISEGSDVSSTNHIVDRGRKRAVLLQSAVVLVDGEKSQKRARLVLDGGSQRSYISRALAEAVGAKRVGSERMTVDVAFSRESAGPRRYPERLVRLFDRDGGQCIEMTLTETENPCSRYSLLPSEWVTNEMQRRGLKLAEQERQEEDSDHSACDILIGSDWYWSIVSGRCEKLTPDLVACETIFGWVLQGPDRRNSFPTSSAITNHITTLHVRTSEISDTHGLDNYGLHAEIENFWKLENLGIKDIEGSSKELTDVELRFEENVERLDKRYRVRLPWNGSESELQPNTTEALRRFHITVRRLQRNDAERLKQYHSSMMDYLVNDHAEQVHEKMSPGPVYYIPHRAVIRETHDTTKLRVVFDASSGRPSLNDCLHAGPHLNPDLLEMLLRFRQNSIGVIADMEKAFLQIEIAPNDRDAARFFWLPRDWKEGDSLEPVAYRMKRVLFGLNCGPFLLAATLRHHLKFASSTHSEVCQLLADSIYVDDLVKSVTSSEEGWRLYDEGRRILAEAGFNLRKWASNDLRLTESIMESECRHDQGEFTVRNGSILSVLGMKWDRDNDEMFFDMSDLLQFLEEQLPTKRVVLRAMARIFDPLGLVAPFTIRLKVLFQDLWKRHVEWDQPLLECDLKVWEEWVNELQHFSGIRIPRYVAQPSAKRPVSRELHVFSDASEKLYGACVYLVERSNDTVTSRLIASKNKVVPLKAMSIPRLELLGALIATRLANTIKKAWNEDGIDTFYWTDSMVALQWILGDVSRWKQFVANRVTEIQSATNKENWHYVPTHQNPADKVTRGQQVHALATSALWWQGPEWLNQSAIVSCVENEYDNEEVNKEAKISDISVLNITEAKRELWDLNRFGRWTKLVRTVGYVLRFITNCRLTKARRQSDALSVDELNKAEKVILWYEQRMMFPNECRLLERGESVSKASSIRRFDPFLDNDGLLRLGGRLHFSTFEQSVKHPVILQGDNRVTQLIIQKCHETVMHGGVSETIAELREKFWVISARAKVNKVLRHCVRCIRKRARPAQTLEGLPPPERFEAEHPFEVIGLDFAGPIYVQHGKNETKKAYVLLITCAVTRAVHLELVASLSADDFLMAFRRFVARRGLCNIIWSDNAKTFKRATKDLELWQGLVDHNKVKEYITEKRVVWKFITDRAPWWGGMWERLVRSVKEKLKTVCGRRTLTFDELRTTLVEVEAILNSRPLGYVSQEDKEILTPAHLLVGRRMTSLPPPSKAAERLTGDQQLGKRWRARLVMLDRFWRSWKRDYLLALRTLHERHRPDCETEITAGMPVLLDDEKTARHLWRVCVVEKTIPGRDGKTRACWVKLPNGNCIKRPIQLLYPLELNIVKETSEIA